MKGDFTRSTFNPRKHYRGVRLQQGRVQLDADWNENLDILLQRLDTETVDVIGACGVPIHDAGFGVVTDFNALTQGEKDWLKKQGVTGLGKGDFLLTQGRAYVDGILVENDHTVPFSRQPFIPSPDWRPPLKEHGIRPPGAGALTGPGMYQLYLDVWERHLTFLEDPAIREVALGGPDTATRVQVVWQVRLAKVGDLGTPRVCADKLTPWPEASTGRLRARTHPEEKPDTPCTVPPGAGYTRLENQLYRVEIHQDSKSGQPTFKWSRDNGSVVVAVEEFAIDGSHDQIRTASLGRDDYLGLHELDWVEVLDDTLELAGKPGELVQIIKIDPGNILTLSKAVPTFDLKNHPKVRRWDSAGEIKVSIPADNDGFLRLEGGVEIQFAAADAHFHTGDYWLIPARTIPGQYGDIEWPQEAGFPAFRPPAGIRHHYCRLAVLTVSEIQGGFKIDPEDCRKKFPPLTELTAGGDHCCSVSVGENGDYIDLQEAVEARPEAASWWTVCVLPGRLSLKDTVTVEGKNARSLTIKGCGEQSYLLGPAGKPALAFSRGANIKLEGLGVDGSVDLADCRNLTVTNCSLGYRQREFAAAGAALVVDKCAQVEIRNNKLVGLPAVQVNGMLIEILNNQIAGGGIQVVPPSRLVDIKDNVIGDGKGAGIQLGGGDKTAADYVAMYAQVQAPPSSLAATDAQPGMKGFTEPGHQALAALRQVKIHRNLIAGMEGSGIITEDQISGGGHLGDVEFLSIRENQIVDCGRVPDVNLGHEASVGGGIAVIGIFSAQITDNFIVRNGSRDAAACGIFVLDGSAVDISDNLVAENGRSTDSDEPRQYQAGIAAHFVYGNLYGSQLGPLGGYPALRVCDNQVFCPAGQALTVMAIGGVVASGNILVSRERLRQPPRPLNFGPKAGCVFLYDFGLPVWWPKASAVTQGLMSALFAAGPAGINLDHVNQEAAPAYPDGRVMFHHNQVTFSSGIVEDLTNLGKVGTIEWIERFWSHLYLSALFVSLDDISLNGNQFQASVPPYIQVGTEKVGEASAGLKFIDAATLGMVVRTTANGFSELRCSNLISYASLGLLNVTTSNEATHWIWASAFDPQKNNAYDNNLSLFPGSPGCS